MTRLQSSQDGGPFAATVSWVHLYFPSNIFHKLADFPPAFKMTTSLGDFSDQTLAMGQMEEEEVDGSHNIFPTLAQNSFEFCSLPDELFHI